MCVKAVPTDVSSSLLMGVLRTLDSASLSCSWKHFQGLVEGWAEVCGSVQSFRCPADAGCHFLERSGHLMGRARWRAVANPRAAGSGCGGSVG